MSNKYRIIETEATGETLYYIEKKVTWLFFFTKYEIAVRETILNTFSAVKFFDTRAQSYDDIYYTDNR